jgi:hypothetical protein
MVNRILLATILCLIPAYAAARTDTGPGRDIAAVHHLIEQYAKAVDTVDLNLISQIWSHSPEVSFPPRFDVKSRRDTATGYLSPSKRESLQSVC